MSDVSTERVELFPDASTCRAVLYLGNAPVLEITAARQGGAPWHSGSEAIFAGLVTLAERLRIEAEKLGIPLHTTAEAKA